MNNKYKPLPLDFDCEGYRKLNKDLANYSNTECKVHYILHGRLENRQYCINFEKIPKDFCPQLYRYYNPDLANFDDNQCLVHYTIYGINENRVYKTKLPDDFDVLQYAFFNKDLQTYCIPRLEAHYFAHGNSEGRKYKDFLFDKDFFIKYNNIQCYKDYTTYSNDITQIKSQQLLDLLNKIPLEHKDGCILLVGHWAEVHGATQFLYNLFNYLKKITNKKIYLLDSYLNKKLLEKYNIKEEEFISYESDSTLLYYICKTLNPHKILLNCINSAMVDLCNYYDNNKIVIHSHETKNYYERFFLELKTPNFVVSNRIKEQYNNDYSACPFVQPEVLTEDVNLNIENQIKNLPNNICNNVNLLLNPEKITIGMSGTLCDRKNYKLFIKLAKHFTNYNFVWIGGNKTIIDEDVENLFHIKTTNTPYQYYNILDYFLLTSLNDPCPYVVLENLYIGNKIITFKENIYTDHKCEELAENYFEYNGEINLENAINAIDLYVTCKPQKNKTGKQYIQKNYSVYNQQYLDNILC